VRSAVFRRRLVVGTIFVLLALRAVGAQAAAAADGILVCGGSGSPHRVLTDDLRALPTTALTVSFETEHGQERASYRGVLLWTLLDHVGAVDAAKPRAHVRQTVSATGRDGYTATLALAEIDPAFEGKQVIVAYDRDGTPLGDDHLRLVVPGDRHGGRSVRDVMRIDVASPGSQCEPGK
jgi:hypothetical protein